MSFLLSAQHERWVAKYDKVFPFAKNNKNWHYVQKGRYYGAVNQAGTEIVPIVHTNILTTDLGAVMIFEKGGKWGTYTPQGKSAAPFMYETIVFQNDRLGVYKRNEKWGYMDTEGEEIIPPQYERATAMNFGRAAVEMNKKWAIINQEGGFVTNFMYDKVENFHNYQVIVVYNGRYGVADTAGKWLIMPMFEEMEMHQGIYKVQQGGKWGFINAQSAELIPFEYDYEDIGTLWTKGGLISAAKNGKWGYFNEKGKLVVPFQYESVLPFYDKLGPVYQDNTWGFVDSTGTLVINFTYDSLNASCWGGDWTGVRKEGKWTVINRAGKQLIAPMYDHIECILDEDPARVGLNGKWGYINREGEIVIPCVYDEAKIYPNEKGLFEVKLAGKTSFLDKKGKEVMKIK